MASPVPASVPVLVTGASSDSSVMRAWALDVGLVRMVLFGFGSDGLFQGMTSITPGGGST